VELVAWVSAETPDSLLSGLANVARELGVEDPDGNSAASATRLRDRLAARKAPAVLVLDNATDTALVRRYLPGAGATRVVITSTDRAFASFGTEIEVGLFDRDQSLAYLAARSNLTDAGGAGNVADELGDLPLALAQAASVIAQQGLSYTTYLERLRALPIEQMLPHDRGDTYPESVARAILLSLASVQQHDPASGLTGRALRSIALLAPDGISRDTLAIVLPVPAERMPALDGVLANLVGASLLVWTKDKQAVVMRSLSTSAKRGSTAPPPLRWSGTRPASGRPRFARPNAPRSPEPNFTTTPRLRIGLFGICAPQLTCRAPRTSASRYSPTASGCSAPTTPTRSNPATTSRTPTRRRGT
jgi:hypothetical protein